MKLKVKLPLIIIGILIVSTILTSVIAYTITTNSLTEEAESHLTSVLELKKARLDDFITQEQDRLASFAYDRHLEELRSESLQYEYGTPEHEKYHTIIRDEIIREVSTTNGYFKEVLIIDHDGFVHLATDPAQEGKIKINEQYFIRGLEGPYVQNFYYDASSQSPAITISQPWNINEEVCVMAAQVNLSKINDIITDISGLGETGETILVNKVNLLVSESRFTEGAGFKKYIYIEPVKECLKGKSDVVQSLDYRGVPGMIAFSWIPDKEVCLIVKKDMTEVLSPVKRLRTVLILVTCLIIGFAILGGLFFSRGIINPITKLKQSAQKISDGNLKNKVVVKCNDEIGDLAKSFETMREKIKKSQDYLESEVAEKTKELQKKLEKEEKTKTAMIYILEKANNANKELEKNRKFIEANNKELTEAKSRLSKFNALLEKKVTDRTKELKDTLIQLEGANEELKSLDKAKSEFISIASHELRSPLTSIIGFIELLLNEPKLMNNPNKSKELLSISFNEAKKLHQLINDILNLSKMDSGKMSFNIIKGDIRPLLESVFNEANVIAKKKGIMMWKNVQRDIPLFNFDRLRLEEALSNIVMNAVKVINKGGRIDINAAKDKEGKKINISVSDNGPGIPKEKLEDIFRPFMQVDNVEMHHEGTGLGLAIAKRIVEAHKGKLSVKSTLKKGTTFTITLPE